MQLARIPDNETTRIKALKLYDILDTMPEGTFDEITGQAASHFNVPIALISLVDTNRQWFKSCIGLSVSQTGRDESFCSHAILENKPFVIKDTHQDSRFIDNPLVTNEPFVRFYAGAPLITQEGLAIGTLCLMDSKPREFSEKDELRLTILARTVMTRLNLRLAGLALQQASDALNVASV